MDLERLQFVPRVRVDAQAIDLGCRLARVFYLRLVWPGLIAWLVMALFVVWVFPNAAYFYSALLLWWLKPLVEQVILLSGSRLVFDERARLKTLCATILKHHLGDLFAQLTWRRLSPFRSFDLPVAYLEGLRGQARQKRIALLHTSGSGLALLLTATCFLIERGLEVGVYLFAYMLLGDPVAVGGDAFAGWSFFSASYEPYHLFILAAVMALVAPFYTMGGFSLYLNRRIALEGWDIDLAFRLMQLRLERNRQGRRKVRGGAGVAALSGVFVLLLSGLLMFAPGTCDAQTVVEPASIDLSDAQALMPKTESTRQASRLSIEDILNGEDFHRLIRQGVWVPIEPKPKPKPAQPPTLHSERWIRLIEWLEKHGLIGAEGVEEALLLLSEILRAFFVFIVVAPLIYLLIRYRKLFLQWMERLSGLRAERSVVAASLSATSVQSQKFVSLPDVPASVRSLWQSGQVREALSLWYRQTLLEMGKTLPIEPHHTEHECLRLIKAQCLEKSAANPKLRQRSMVFERLVVLWQQCAYGQRQPEPEAFDALLKLWTQVLLHEA